jgi:hypothetical protein
MRLHSSILALAFTIMACSAESAPDNAAGSIKQAPVEADKTQVIEGIDGTSEVDPEEGKKKKGGKGPNSNGPRCGQVEESICPDPSKQKLCSCSSGPGNQGATYNCGCSGGSTGGSIETAEIQGAEG